MSERQRSVAHHEAEVGQRGHPNKILDSQILGSNFFSCFVRMSNHDREVTMSDSTIPCKSAGHSKRWISYVISICTFAVGLASIPFIGKAKWIVIAAGVATLVLQFVSSTFGIRDSGKKINFPGRR